MTKIEVCKPEDNGLPAKVSVWLLNFYKQCPTHSDLIVRDLTGRVRSDTDTTETPCKI